MEHGQANEPTITEQPRTAETRGPFFLTCGSFVPGEADRFLASQTDPVRRLICETELFCYRGHPDRCLALSSELKRTGNPDAVMTALLSDVFSALSLGNTDLLFGALRQLEEDAARESDPQRRQAIDYFLSFFNLLTCNRSEMHFPVIDVNAFSLPEAVLPFVIYNHAYQLILCGDYGRAIGLAEGALIRMRCRTPVPEIFLSLITSTGYLCRLEWDKADYYFRHAWEIAAPDRLFLPFVLHKPMLSGMMERYVRYSEPDIFKMISHKFGTFYKNWVTVHNLLTGEHLTDQLTVTELNVAVLASRGLSNQEIAGYLCVSVNSVRSHLRNIFNKLEITNRKKLSEFVVSFPQMF